MRNQKREEPSPWSGEPRLVENEAFFAVYDKYPVSKGHMLIVSKRDVCDLFDLTEDEFCALHEIIHHVKNFLDSEYAPQGFNIGANCGVCAGQTIFRFHLHVIPRYNGDIANPRGGIRNIKEPDVTY